MPVLVKPPELLPELPKLSTPKSLPLDQQVSSLPSGTPPTPAVAPTPASPQFAPASVDAVVSPQMLLKYFDKSTNGGGSVLAPVEFLPPKAVAPNQSSATFSTGP
jgi:hypothetical protein